MTETVRVPMMTRMDGWMDGLVGLNGCQWVNDTKLLTECTIPMRDFTWWELRNW